MQLFSLITVCLQEVYHGAVLLSVVSQAAGPPAVHLPQARHVPQPPLPDSQGGRGRQQGQGRSPNSHIHSFKSELNKHIMEGATK